MCTLQQIYKLRVAHHLNQLNILFRLRDNIIYLAVKILSCYQYTMNKKEIVKAGYNTISDAYLASRNKDSEDVRLLDELVQRLPQGASVLDAGCELA